MDTKTKPDHASLSEVRSQYAGGSEKRYHNRELIGRRYIYTEGVKAHMEHADSYFVLIDILAKAKLELSDEQRGTFTVWELVVPWPGHTEYVKSFGRYGKRNEMTAETYEGVRLHNRDANDLPQAILTCRQDSDMPVQCNQVYDWGFSHPGGRWKFYLCKGGIMLDGDIVEGYTLMLPNEY